MQADTLLTDYNITQTDSAAITRVDVRQVFTDTYPAEKTSYPYSGLINREISPDWILFICLGFLVVYAWINIIFTRFITSILHSTVNFQVSQKLYNDPNLVQKRVSSLFWFSYYITFGLFCFLILDYFFPDMLLEYSEFINYLIICGFLLGLSLVRIILYHLTASIFDRRKLFKEALFQNFLYNKLTGISIIPFIILVAYTKGIIQDVSVWAGLSVILGVNILRLLRAAVFIRKNVVSLFYFILYLCSLEILPVLVIFRLIFFFMSKGS